MPTPASECRERARTWAQTDNRLLAAIVYGSVAHADDNDFSDLDLVLVAKPGQRESLWGERALIAERLLEAAVVWSQDLPWQRPFRYQAWRAGLMCVDLTFDEERAHAWAGPAAGFEMLLDRGGVEAMLREDLSRAPPPQFDAHAFDAGTWPWLLWLAGRWRHGEYWFVRTGLYDTLSNRIVPLLGATPIDAEGTLDAVDIAALNSAAPASAEPDELRRALEATAALYGHALDRWAARTGLARPHHPLARAIKERIAALHDYEP